MGCSLRASCLPPTQHRGCPGLLWPTCTGHWTFGVLAEANTLARPVTPLTPAAFTRLPPGPAHPFPPRVGRRRGPQDLRPPRGVSRSPGYPVKPPQPAPEADAAHAQAAPGQRRDRAGIHARASPAAGTGMGRRRAGPASHPSWPIPALLLGPGRPPDVARETAER